MYSLHHSNKYLHCYPCPAGISFLLDKNADPGLKNKDGQFPFELLLEQDESENVRMSYDDALTLAEAIKVQALVFACLVIQYDVCYCKLTFKEYRIYSN